MKGKHEGAAFRVGLIQMRSARSPAANRDAAVGLIEQAKRDGADYVQTPEMTNIMEVRRDNLFATIVPEEQDTTLAAFRDLARRL
ncbi:MAG: carbon-nitrogen hydrolase family protein, partial [Xanthobacteraceae bacterium]|nr:carbon-nitrogen hydrolase family protein [Xanthobacteraceae bacterium]